MAGGMERSSTFTAKGLLRPPFTVRARSNIPVTISHLQDIPDTSFTGNGFSRWRTIEGLRPTSWLGGRNVTKRVEITVPEPIYNYLRRMAKANLTSVGKEARTALVRGALVEWRSEEISMGATMSAISMNTELPLEVVMEALGPVIDEGPPLKGYD